LQYEKGYLTSFSEDNDRKNTIIGRDDAITGQITVIIA